MVRKTLVLLAVLVSLVSAFAFMGGSTHTHASTSHSNYTNMPNIGGPGGVYYAVVTNSCGSCYENSPYQVTVGPGTGASISQSWTASNTWGATVGITSDAVNAAVNFNVTASTTVSETCTAPTNTTSHYQTLIWFSYYDETFFNVYWRDTAGSHYEGTGYATNYNHPGCDLAQQ